jgi:GT2 family glycosyltransferase
VAVPTHNRPEYLMQSLQSIIDQSYKNISIIVLDNCSDPKYKIEDLVNSFGDKRIRYKRNTMNIGIIGNWNRAIELCDTKYLSIFHDDDLMKTDFIEKSINALENNLTAAFSYTQANKVDSTLRFVSLWSENILGEGLIKGEDYLKYTIKKGCCITIAPTVVVRKEIYDNVGLYQDELCFNSFDFNMWIRICQQYDVYFINEALVDYRIHDKQMSQTYWWSEHKCKGRLATMFEVQKALSYLIKSDKITNDRSSEYLEKYTKLASEYARKLISDL